MTIEEKYEAAFNKMYNQKRGKISARLFIRLYLRSGLKWRWDWELIDENGVVRDGFETDDPSEIVDAVVFGSEYVAPDFVRLELHYENSAVRVWRTDREVNRE